MALKFNPTTGKLDIVPSISGLVPYQNATADVNLGVHNLTVRGPIGVNIDSGGSLNIKTADNVYQWLIFPVTANELALYGGSAPGGAILNIDNLTTDKTFTFPNATGTLALQEYNTSNILSTTTAIDAKVVATTNLYTVPTGKTAIITGAVIRVTTATAITVVPTLGIGIAAGEDDIISSTALTGLNATTKFYRFSVEGVAVIGAATNIIKLGIDTGATATTMTIAVDLIGYLV